MLIMRGTLTTYKPCAIAKAKQKNLNNESEGAKADRFNEQVYNDTVTMKESNKDKSLVARWSGISSLKKQSTSSGAHSLFPRVKCQQICVCIHATQESTWTSDCNYLTRQCWQKQEADHSGAFKLLEA
jgi:hypothetical protein